MTIPRSILVDETQPSCFHLYTRCARGARLCGRDERGKSYAHRRSWIKLRIRELDGLFAIDTLSYSVTPQELDLVVQLRPDVAERWCALEIARRALWLMPSATFPEAQRVKAEKGATISPHELAEELAKDEAWIEKQRQRLRSPSWFMKFLKEHIARKANGEDHVRGVFWDGRFKSVALLDPAAVLACCIYIDLNLLRKGLATGLKDSIGASIADRITAKRRPHICEGVNLDAWLRPFKLPPGPAGAAIDLGVSFDQYVRLVDETGRQLREGGAARIAPQLERILGRLNVDTASWIPVMRRPDRFHGTAVGCRTARDLEAGRRGSAWVVGGWNLYPSARCSADHSSPVSELKTVHD